MTPSRRLWTVGGAVLLSASSAVWLVKTNREPQSRFNTVPLEELGRIAAGESVRLASDSAGVLIWHLQPSGTGPADPWEQAFRIFRARLDQPTRRRSITEVTQSVDLQETPLASALSPARFQELLSQCPPDGVLMLWGALPQLTSADIERLPANRPKVLAVLMQAQPAKPLFENQILHVLVGPRPPTTPSANQPKTAAQWFDRFFCVITPETATSLPD